MGSHKDVHEKYKNKRLILTILTVIVFKLMNGQGLKINLSLDSCIYLNGENPVVFVLTNEDSVDCWVKTEHLPIYFGIYSEDEEIVSRKTSQQNDRLNQGEYTKIEGNSTVKIMWNLNFENYNLVKNQKYFIQTSYEYNHLTREEKKRVKKTDFKLIQSRINAKSGLFSACKY